MRVTHQEYCKSMGWKRRLRIKAVKHIDMVIGMHLTETRTRSASARLEGRVNRSPAAASLTAGQRSDYKGLRFPGAAPAFASGFWAVMVILDCSRCTLPGLLFDIFRIFSGFSAGPVPDSAFCPKFFYPFSSEHCGTKQVFRALFS